MDKQNQSLEILWVKLVLQLISLAALLITIIILPKTVFDTQTAFSLATSMAVINEDSLLLYDYEVYATEARFNQALIEDFEKVQDSFKERSEIVAIQIYGDIYRINLREDYIFITNQEVPELNIEYYLVRNLEFDGITFPIRTFVILFEDIASLINTIYIVVFIVISLAIFSRLTIKCVINVSQISKRLQKEI